MSNEHAAPQRLSHEVDDFAASGIYSGGTNNIVDASFVTWDYNGSQPPDSNTALMLKCLPTDGSNDGKEHIEYWNVGSAADYMPDLEGKFLMGNKQPSQSCNFFQFMKSLRDNCGLERGVVSKEGVGIKALIASEITFIRHEVKRDFKDNAAPEMTASGAPRQQNNKPQTALIATKAKFSWEKAGKAKAGKVMPSATPQAPAQATQSAAPPAAAPANGDNPLIPAIMEILAANDNAISLTDLPSKVTEKLGLIPGMTTGRRLNLLKTIKDPAQLEALASANGWAVDTEEGVLLVDDSQ